MALYPKKKKRNKKLLTTTKSINIQNLTKALSRATETKLNEQNRVNVVIFLRARKSGAQQRRPLLPSRHRDKDRQRPGRGSCGGPGTPGGENDPDPIPSARAGVGGLSSRHPGSPPCSLARLQKILVFRKFQPLGQKPPRAVGMGKGQLLCN